MCLNSTLFFLKLHLQSESGKKPLSSPNIYQKKSNENEKEYSNCSNNGNQRHCKTDYRLDGLVFDLSTGSGGFPVHSCAVKLLGRGGQIANRAAPVAPLSTLFLG